MSQTLSLQLLCPPQPLRLELAAALAGGHAGKLLICSILHLAELVWARGIVSMKSASSPSMASVAASVCSLDATGSQAA